MYLSHQIINYNYLIETLINIIIALFVGYLMYEIGLWTAGDSKLFVAYSSLVPISVFELGYVPFFPAMVILINTFVPVFVFFFFRLIFKTTTQQKINALMGAFNPKKIVVLAIFLFSIMWVIQIIFSLIGRINAVIPVILSNYFIMIFLLFLTMTYLERILRVNVLKISIILAILRLGLDWSIYSMDFLRYFLIVFLSFLFIRFFILELSFTIYTHYVDINLLKPGMVPAEVIYEENKEYKTEPILHFSFLSYLQAKTSGKKYIFEHRSGGLTEEEVTKLRELYQVKKIKFEHLKIQPTIPFAPFMFLGVILTIIFRGNILIYLVS
jgi:hypothetical protein